MIHLSISSKFELRCKYTYLDWQTIDVETTGTLILISTGKSNKIYKLRSDAFSVKNNNNSYINIERIQIMFLLFLCFILCDCAVLVEKKKIKLIN